MRRSVRVSCGLGGHVRDRHRCREGEYALVSSGFTKTAHPACPLACAPAALGCADRPEYKFSPLNCAPRCRVAHLPRNVEYGTTPLPPHTARPCAHPRCLAPSRQVTQVGPDCEGGGLQGRRESGFGPATRTSEPPGRPRTGSGGEGTPHFSPQDGWGPRELAAETQGQAYPHPRGVRAS